MKSFVGFPFLCKRIHSGLLPAFWMAAMLFFLFLPEEASAARHALLVSINTYAEARTKEGGVIRVGELKAPDSDVRRLAELLPAWGFLTANIRLVQNEKASRNGILKEIEDLYARTAPGDDVLIYYSGHGTSWLNSASGSERGKIYSSALIPWDYALLRGGAVKADQALLDARRDLRPLFQRLDEGGRSVLLVMDSCYSGALRSGEMAGTVRFVPVENFVVTDDMEQAPEIEPLLSPGTYRRLTLLSAAAIGQRAAEVSRSEELERWPTEDGKPHGVFTDALLRVLAGKLGADYDRDKRITPRELHEAIGDFVASRGFAQTPMLLPGPDEDTSPLNRPLFGIGHGGQPALPAYGKTRPLRIELAQPMPQLERSLANTPDVTIQQASTAPGKHADLIISEMDGGVRITHASGGEVETLVEDTEGKKTYSRISQLVISSRLRQLAMKYARGLLPFAVRPQQFGELVPEGERISFIARPDKNAAMVIIALSAKGKISTLYPLNQRERALAQENRTWLLARSGADPVVAPCGSGEHVIFAFAFDHEPDGLDQLANLQDADATAALPVIEQLLSVSSGAFVRAEKRLRTVVVALPQGAAASRICGKS